MFAVLTRQTATQDRQGTAAKTNKRDKQGKTIDTARRKRKKNRRKWRKSAVEAWGIFYINRKSLKNPQPISSFLHYPTFHPSSRLIFRSKIPFFQPQNHLKTPQFYPKIPLKLLKMALKHTYLHLFWYIGLFLLCFDRWMVCISKTASRGRLLKHFLKDIVSILFLKNYICS